MAQISEVKNSDFVFVILLREFWHCSPNMTIFKNRINEDSVSLQQKKIHFLYFCADLFRNWEKYFFAVVVYKLYSNSSMSWDNREQGKSTQKNMITVKDNDS